MRPSEHAHSSAVGGDVRLTQLDRWVAHLHALMALGALTAVTGLVGFSVDQPLLPLALAGAVGGALAAGGRWLAGELRRERLDDLILSGAGVDCPAMLAEVDRLTARGNVEHLAATLERALQEGERWPQLMPACRPPFGARRLPDMADDVRRISAGLRTPHVPPRAVVLVERLVRGGYGSAVYEAHPDWLHRELGRIRFALEAASAQARSTSR
jgi:hypothetical protein